MFDAVPEDAVHTLSEALEQVAQRLDSEGSDT